MFLLVQGRVCEFISSTMQNFIYFAVLTIISTLAMRTSSRVIESTDLINRVENPVIVAHSYPTMIKSIQDNTDESEGNLCQIEYQVTRKRTGKCMKLSHGVTGCVSGDYMNPFHSDCF